MLKEIGERIRKYRKEAGMTSDDLAVGAGLTQPFISRIENGRVPRVSIETIVKISRALKCPVSVLIGEERMSSETLRAIELLRTVLKNEKIEKEVAKDGRKKKKKKAV